MYDIVLLMYVQLCRLRGFSYKWLNLESNMAVDRFNSTLCNWTKPVESNSRIAILELRNQQIDLLDCSVLYVGKDFIIL